MTDEPTIAGIAQRDPAAAYESLQRGGAVLVDVRTRAEWSFVGLPDLSALGAAPLLIEWRRWPDMSPNPEFAAQLTGELGATPPSEILFICRSGARSQDAAMAVQAECGRQGLDVRCINVAEGFEGDLGPDGHRGAVNGWKARALPWRQS